MRGVRASAFPLQHLVDLTNRLRLALDMNYTLVYFLAFLMLAVGVGFIVFVYRNTGRIFPPDVAERLGVLMSMVLVAAAGLLLFVTLRVESGDTFVRPSGPHLTDAELNAPAPNFSFRLVDSEGTKQLEDYRGDVVVINFWATWCAPCLQELPDLNELQTTYADAGLTVLTISDEAREVLVDFEERLPLETVAGFIEDRDDVPDPYRRTLEVRPTTYVIDREGVIRDFVLGARDYEAFERMIAPYLAGELALSSPTF